MRRTSRREGGVRRGAGSWRRRTAWSAALVSLALASLASGVPSEAAEERVAPVPMRPLPAPSDRPLGTGPHRFVDPAKGDDKAAGTMAAPWKTLDHACRQLKPGDVLVLRGGIYREHVVLRRSGTEEAPIILRGHPGELAVIDGGLREFLEHPETAWEPFVGGAPDEYVSTRTYPSADDRRVAGQFLPAAWEPMWGIEEERPLVLGHFADSMIPLHGYRLAVDLRSTNELWLAGKTGMRDVGVYCGPGLWFDRETGRIHVRLAHTKLPGLADRGYRGETDPRKAPLVVAAGYGDDVLRISGIRHVKVQDLVLRGATGSPLIRVYGSQGIEFDGVTAFGGFPGLLIDASQKIRVVRCAFRGLAAPWTSRAHMKYRGTASYQIVLRNDQPLNDEIEFAWSEFTDDHDFAYLRPVGRLRFHHNLVDNFNDDGLECGAKLRSHRFEVWQNRIGRCYIPITAHEIDKDESPAEHDPDSGLFLFRNVIDLRGGTYTGPPAEADPTGAFLRREGHLAGDHGGPTWVVMRAYHNTFLRDTPVFRDYFLFGLGAQALRQTERDVFNNLFVQNDRVPGTTILGKEAANLREGGNLLWGVQQGTPPGTDHFARFRTSSLFALSREKYEAGWTTHDQVADPKFVSYPTDGSAPDLRLQEGSPAIDFGRPIPESWPDPLRAADAGPPDSGALPLGTPAWGVGIDGRIGLFDGRPTGASKTSAARRP